MLYPAELRGQMERARVMIAYGLLRVKREFLWRMLFQLLKENQWIDRRILTVIVFDAGFKV